MKRRADYSQNFLRSPQLVADLISRSNLKKEDVVFDLGAGSGIISSVLAKNVKDVIAVEFEPKTVEILKRNVGEVTNVTIKVEDILKIKFPSTPYKVFANIPFHLSSPIILRFISDQNKPEAVYLIVQKQFGRKLVATDTSHFTSQLGMILGAQYKVRVIKSLRRTDFWPHPAVDTVCIELLKRPEPLVAKDRLKSYEKFTIDCFSDPKKLSKMPLHIIGVTPGVSPSRLSLDQWLLLFHNQKVY